MGRLASGRRRRPFFLKEPGAKGLSWTVTGADPAARQAIPPDEQAARSPPTLEGLFRDHAGDVFRFVRHQLGPAAEDSDVEDLTQRVFIAAGRGLSKFRGDSRPSTWLYRIASRIVLKHLESHRRHRALLERVEAAALTLEPVMSAEERLVRQEELRLVWRCLMTIKPSKRMVLLLHRVDGRSGKEIADILQIKEATVWTRLHHARKELGQALERLRAQGVWHDR